MLLSLRPIAPGDRAFLYQVYASTRAEELAPLGWTDEQLTAFLTMQFEAQHRFYQEHFPQAAFDIILRDGQPIGRIYLAQLADQLCVIDIALLPAHRRCGIGSAFLRAILAEGQRLGLPVRLHVEQFNPALQLYQRLGFRQIDEHGVYLHLERPPTRDAR